MGDDLKKYIRNWPGNRRSDLTHLQAQPHLFPVLVDKLAAPFLESNASHVAAIDGGGFGLGGAVAYRLDAGLVLIRKQGRIDWQVQSAAGVDYTGTEKGLEIAIDAVSEADRVLVVDDWAESGGQLRMAIELLEQLGAFVVGAACLHITPEAMKSPNLSRYPLHCIVHYQ